MSDVTNTVGDAPATQPTTAEPTTAPTTGATPAVTDAATAKAAEASVVTGGTDSTPVPEHGAAAPAVTEGSSVAKEVKPETTAEGVKPEIAPVEKKETSTKKAEVTPVTEGTLGYKAPGLVKSFRFSKKYFWFGEEAVASKDLHNYLRGEKPEVAHPNAAWSTHTGKGLLFFTKHASDKASPAGIINLSDISELTYEGLVEFHFKLHGHKHTFQAATGPERDGWVAALKPRLEQAKTSVNEITGSPGYKEQLEKLSKPSTVGAAGATTGESATTKKRTEKSPAAKTPVDKAAAPVKRDTSTSSSSSDGESKKAKTQKSRSQSRNKRASIFGSILGKKEEQDEKKQEKKEAKVDDKVAAKHDQKDEKKADKAVAVAHKDEKRADKAAKHEHKEEKKADKAVAAAHKEEHKADKAAKHEQKEEKNAEKAEKRAEEAEKKAEREQAKTHETSVVAPVPVTTAESKPIPPSKDEKPVEQAIKSSEPKATDKPLPATTKDTVTKEPTKETPKAAKRTSIWGSIFPKKDVTSPTEEKKEPETAPIVPPKATDAPAATSTSTAPATSVPVTTTPATTTPATAAEPASGDQADPKTATITPVTIPATTSATKPISTEKEKKTSSPSREKATSPPKEGFFGKFMKQEKKAESKVQVVTSLNTPAHLQTLTDVARAVKGKTPSKTEDRKEEKTITKDEPKAVEEPKTTETTSDAPVIPPTVAETEAPTKLTTDKETPAPAPEASPEPITKDRRRSSFFGTLSSKKERKTDASDSEGTSKFGGIVRKASRAVKGQKDTSKKEPAPAAPITEKTDNAAVEDKTAAPAATGASAPIEGGPVSETPAAVTEPQGTGEGATNETSINKDGAIGDVVPEAVTVGQPADQQASKQVEATA
ncbi:MAG: hypothetical protein M1833_007100 [Piccolia ochrophora]|nr:MAG: hypothetical protein M1833_007100 [Piccolia ochrophora]